MGRECDWQGEGHHCSFPAIAKVFREDQRVYLCEGHLFLWFQRWIDTGGREFTAVRL